MGLCATQTSPRTLPIRVTDALSTGHRRAPHRSRRATPDSSTQFHPSTACRARGFRGEFRKPFSAGIRRTGNVLSFAACSPVTSSTAYTYARSALVHPLAAPPLPFEDVKSGPVA